LEGGLKHLLACLLISPGLLLGLFFVDETIVKIVL
jgi:hypothetical protein